MTNDRQITITVGECRNSTQWRAEHTTVSALYARLSTPVIGTETHAEYMNFPKSQQDRLKDVGGFVGGALNGTRRKAVNVIGRDIVTLDFDNIASYQTDAVKERVEGLGCNYCIYSTRKHTPTHPRLRIIIPLDRTATPEEYEPIARRIAQQIGIGQADKTTFDVSRLMYWPSKCADTEYVYAAGDKPFISADMVLGTYTDWHDVSTWPQVPGDNAHKALATKQGDPLEKPGTVGAFCRTYSIEDAMSEFLPGVYEPVDNVSDRYTFAGGSTTGGAIVYDGKFLYSHHATDPCGEKLVNAFDLVRLHKFGALDDDVDDTTPTTKRPSFLEMCKFAEQDKKCRSTLNRERQAAAAAEFGGVAAADVSADWRDALEYKPNSDILKNTINNYLVILGNDPALKGKFAYNGFAECAEVFGALPWNDDTKRRRWTDADTNGLYWYIESVYKQAGRGNIDSALSLHLSQSTFNEVQDYINGLTWDGVKRLDTLFVDYLGAEDCEYTRTVTRKMFVAGIARAMHPGTKFDNMLILVGRQGLGKSTLLSRMAHGWFNDSICSFEGKEAAELLQGIWLVEISELDAFRKSETTRVKQFLSLCSDIYRAAYAHNPEERKRRCIFFGTTNTYEFLKDPTGERRFWPVDTAVNKPKYDVFNELTEDVISQVWAEARAYWALGELLHLTPEMEAEACKRQLEHKETSAKEGLIRDFIDKQVPEDWAKWSITNRLTWWGDNTPKEGVKLVKRGSVCAAEIWVECLHSDLRYMKNSDAREINGILAHFSEWEYCKKTMRFGTYGVQRGFKRQV